MLVNGIDVVLTGSLVVFAKLLVSLEVVSDSAVVVKTPAVVVVSTPVDVRVVSSVLVDEVVVVSGVVGGLGDSVVVELVEETAEQRMFCT